jgi:alpha-methylacyl-CoA racemase
VTSSGSGPAGPLQGVRVLDLSALGPGPFCSMLLADFGAEVVTVERPDPPAFDPARFFSRGKRSTVVDLRAPGGTDVVARLADRADVLLESNRPGTMERRGLGPDVLCARNPRLVYTRLTGWGQDGPYRGRAGHDVNYIGVAGVLGVLGGPDADGPQPPLAMLGDIAGGSLFAALGIVMALFERAVTGRGQVVDAAIVDGAAVLNTPQLGELNAGLWAGRGAHLLSGAAPFYGVYRCADDGWFAVGAIEPKFYAQLLRALDLDDVDLGGQLDPKGWAALRTRVADAFAAKPRSHWAAVFADVDGCGTPVLDLDELADDPHLRARGTIVDDGSGLAAAPAPRLSRTPGRLRPGSSRGADTRAVLAEAGFTPDRIAQLVASGTVLAAD